MEHLSNDYKDCPTQHESSHKPCNERGHIPFRVWWKANENWETNMIRTSQWGKATAEKILASEEINK